MFKRKKSAFVSQLNIYVYCFTKHVINNVFSQNKINIAGQYLQTNDQVGYVVIEVDADYSDVALAELKSIEGTIRCRVIY